MADRKTKNGYSVRFPFLDWQLGAISWYSSLRILGEMSSGPEALFGESPCRSLSTPSIDISIICILGAYIIAIACLASCFKLRGCGLENTDSNCIFIICALSTGSVYVRLWCFSGATPHCSVLLCLINE